MPLAYQTYGKYAGPVTTRRELLDDALAILRRGEALTLDSVARESGMTKPGVVHHFATKEGLMEAVVDHLAARWEAELKTVLNGHDGHYAHLKAYVEHSFLGEFDNSDLAPLADVKLRQTMLDRWSARIAPWLQQDDDTDPAGQSSRTAARLMADGAWLNQALGVIPLDIDQRREQNALALSLINKGTTP